MRDGEKPCPTAFFAEEGNGLKENDVTRPSFNRERIVAGKTRLENTFASTGLTLLVCIPSGVALTVALLQEEAGQRRKTQDKQVLPLSRHRKTDENTGQPDSPLKIP